MNYPRVFFGTMHSNESEFDQCKLMVSLQKDLQSHYHQIIEGLQEKEAHNALWASWESQKENFDLFVKIDADTVLMDEYSISRVWKLFEENKRVTGVQIRLHDYFTDSLISGLNFFSPVVKFNTSPDLYCDRVDTNHDVVLKGDCVKHLEPIGYHCKNPSLAQSFHYGLHRMLKNQVETMRKVSKAKREEQRKFALLGASFALNSKSKFLSGDNSSYSSSVFIESYEEALNLSPGDQDILIANLEKSL